MLVATLSEVPSSSLITVAWEMTSFLINFYFSHEIPELNNFSGIEINSRECPKMSGSFGILRVKMIDHISHFYTIRIKSAKFYFMKIIVLT